MASAVVPLGRGTPPPQPKTSRGVVGDWACAEMKHIIEADDFESFFSVFTFDHFLCLITCPWSLFFNYLWKMLSILHNLLMLISYTGYTVSIKQSQRIPLFLPVLTLYYTQL